MAVALPRDANYSIPLLNLAMVTRKYMKIVLLEEISGERSAWSIIG